MYKCLQFLISTIISACAFAQSESWQSIVVVRPVSGMTQETSSERVSFYTAEIVQGWRRKPRWIVVSKFGDKKSVWIPSASVAGVVDFRKIERWPGQARFEIFTHSGDAGIDYDIRRDRTFRAKLSNNHAPGDRQTTGRLHRRGAVVWAKAHGRQVNFDAWDVFRQLPNGALCNIEIHAPSGSECVMTGKASSVPC